MKRLLSILSAFSLLLLGSTTSLAEQVESGDAAPDFELIDQDGQLHSIEDYRGKWVALYFYPKDDTPGCTTEACEFRDNIFAFKNLDCQILGVSLDCLFRCLLTLRERQRTLMASKRECWVLRTRSVRLS